MNIIKSHLIKYIYLIHFRLAYSHQYCTTYRSQRSGSVHLIYEDKDSVGALFRQTEWGAPCTDMKINIFNNTQQLLPVSRRSRYSQDIGENVLENSAGSRFMPVQELKQVSIRICGGFGIYYILKYIIIVLIIRSHKGPITRTSNILLIGCLRTNSFWGSLILTSPFSKFVQ